MRAGCLRRQDRAGKPIQTSAPVKRNTLGLEAVEDDTAQVEMPQHRCRATDVALTDGARAVVVASDPAPAETKPAEPNSSPAPRPNCWPPCSGSPA